MMSSSSESLDDIKTSIAPWVLPREDIPINVQIPLYMDFNEIHIKIPRDFKFVDFFNVEEVNFDGNNVAIIKGIIKAKTHNAPVYFGFIVASREIPEKLKTSKKIFIEIHSNNEIIKKIKLNARIFRPILEVTDIIKKIELNDDQKVYKVPMNLKYIGFGDIKLKREGVIRGRIVSQGESLVDEVLRRIYVVVQKDPDIKTSAETCENRNNVHFADDSIKRITEQIEKKVLEGNIEDVISDMDTSFLKRYFKSSEAKKEFLQIVYTKLDDILINFLTEVVDKHPTDNVMLTDSKTDITTKIDSQLEKIIIRVLYKDKLDNIYPAIEIPIEIVDKRVKDTEASINLPMLIKKVEEEPFMDVAEMKIEEDD